MGRGGGGQRASLLSSDHSGLFAMARAFYFSSNTILGKGLPDKVREF